MFCRFRSLFCVELCKNMNEMVEIIQKIKKIEKIYGHKGLGIRSTIAAGRRKALNLLQEAYLRGKRYDICFVNWDMKNSEEAPGAIRSLFVPEPLLVSFSNGPEVFEIKMKQAGADYALKRPLFQSALYDLMKEICRKDRKERLL